MIRSFVFFTLLIAIQGEEQKFKNVEVTTDKGGTAKCTFTIVYTADPLTVNKKKSQAVCKPKVTGIAATVLDLKEVGDVDFEFKINKGKGKVTSAELVQEVTN